MIIAPTPAFYTLELTGESAQQLISTMAKQAGRHITRVTVMSRDHDTDIEAAGHLDSAISAIQLLSHETPVKTEIYNPLYVPAPIELIDELLVIDGSGGAHFVGLDGSPFTFKQVKLQAGDMPLVEGKVQYRPFPIPTYMEIVEAHGGKLN